jgi:hypothetical protein
MVRHTTEIKTRNTSLLQRALLTPLYSFIFAVFAVFVFATNAFAVDPNYDCGTYGSGNYNEVCSDSSTTPSPTSPSTGTTSNERLETIPSTLNPSVEPENVSTVPNAIILDSYADYLKDGKKFFAQIGQIFYFKVDSEQHSVTVKSFNETEVIVTIASTPRDVTIPLGSTINYDVDENGTKDIAIDFGAINGDTVEMTFKKLATTSTVQPEGENTPLVASTSDSSPWIFVAIGALVAVIIAAIVIVLRRKSAVPPSIPPASL